MILFSAVLEKQKKRKRKKKTAAFFIMIMKMKVSWSWFMFCFGAYFSGRHFGSENKGPECNNLAREGNQALFSCSQLLTLAL